MTIGDVTYIFSIRDLPGWQIFSVLHVVMMSSESSGLSLMIEMENCSFTYRHYRLRLQEPFLKYKASFHFET